MLPNVTNPHDHAPALVVVFRYVIPAVRNASLCYFLTDAMVFGVEITWDAEDNFTTLI